MSGAAAKARKFDVLLEEQAGRCHWCECKVVRLSALDKSTIVMERHYFVVWRLPDGRTTQAMIASLDHVIPASRGGPDALHNLVVACKKCNEERGRELDLPQQQGQRPQPAHVAPRVAEPVGATIEADRSKVIFW